jgi:hypothetical protein
VAVIWLLKLFFNKRGVSGPFFDKEDGETDEEMAASDSHGVVRAVCIRSGLRVDG